MLNGFKNFLMRGDVVVTAVGLVIALAFSTLVKAFTDNVITPLVNALRGDNAWGLSWQITGSSTTTVNFGAFISAVVYFVVFMAVVYYLIVLP